jgi:hypothetical protein
MNLHATGTGPKTSAPTIEKSRGTVFSFVLLNVRVSVNCQMFLSTLHQNKIQTKILIGNWSTKSADFKSLKLKNNAGRFLMLHIISNTVLLGIFYI